MTFSKIAQSIAPSATLKLNARATQMRLAGEPVIHLGGGEPKSKAPQPALDAAVEHLKTGEVRYTPAYHQLMDTAVRHGMHAAPWSDPRPNAHLLRAAGRTDVAHLEGGVLAWIEQVDPSQQAY